MNPTEYQAASESSGTLKTGEFAPHDANRGIRRWFKGEPAVHWGLVLAALLAVGWVRMLPLSLGGVTSDAARLVLVKRAKQIAAGLPAGTAPAEGERLVAAELRQWTSADAKQFISERDATTAQLRSQLTYVGKDGARHVFLGGYDSYHWLRMARNYLRTGTTCDAVRGDRCIDTYANAPVGRVNIYARSLHITAIVALDRLITFFRPGYPLASSAFLVPVIVGLLGVFPAFAIGRRLGGNLGGLAAALTIGINPLFLKRSLSSDNDVWNIVLPLLFVWAAIEASLAERPRRQIGYALTAAAVVGLHAATWSGWPMAYGAALLAMLANLGLESLRAIIAKYRHRAHDAARLRRAALVLAVFYVAGAICVRIAGVDSYFSVPLILARQALGPYLHRSAAAGLNLWPNVFSTVAELRTYNLTGIAGLASGQLPFFAGWFGLLLMLIPRREWRMRHYAVLLVGNYLYWFLLTDNPGRLALLVLLASLMAVALAMALLEMESPSDLPAGLIIGVWFLAALFLSYQGLRFVMLLVAPSGIAFGVAFGRLHQWFDEQVLRLTRPRIGRILRPVVFASMAAMVFLLARPGYQTAYTYVPPINDAWSNTFDAIRRTSAPDSIVTTWWDYGYWAEYIAERRVSADGGSLATHIPYWIGRVLAAPTDRQSAGLLRMLDCGSDSTPLPEGREGAWGKLAADGVGPIRAQEILSHLTQLDRAQADAYLAAQNLGPDARADILRSTHCDAPPAYLILTSRMETLSGWWQLANWDFTRDYIFKRDRPLPEAKAVADMVARFGYTPSQAQALYEKANAIGSPLDKLRFLEPALNNLNSSWFKCRTAADSTLICDANVRAGTKYVIRQVLYKPDSPDQSRLLLSRADGKPGRLEITPALFVAAGQKRLRNVTFAAPQWPDVGALVDIPNSRARLGSPGLLRSTFMRLFYLQGRYDTLFTKIGQQNGFAGEQVSTWKVNWQELDKGN